jgi:hypothetical protein
MQEGISRAEVERLINRGHRADRQRAGEANERSELQYFTGKSFRRTWITFDDRE